MSRPDLHQRYREYLAQHKLGVDFTRDEKTWITTGKLKSLALGKGYRLDEIRRALDALKEDVDVAIVWERDSRTERICLYPMSKEERRRAIADCKWFDRLPE